MEIYVCTLSCLRRPPLVGRFSFLKPPPSPAAAGRQITIFYCFPGRAGQARPLLFLLRGPRPRKVRSAPLPPPGESSARLRASCFVRYTRTILSISFSDKAATSFPYVVPRRLASSVRAVSTVLSPLVPLTTSHPPFCAAGTSASYCSTGWPSAPRTGCSGP